eukprot:scaffold62766_cov49-Prasinocladus_malaysianus.AAC.1
MSCPVISYHITPHHIRSCRVESYHITLCRAVSCLITSHRIILWRIALSTPKQKAEAKPKESRLSNKSRMLSSKGFGSNRRLSLGLHQDHTHSKNAEHKIETKQLKDGSQLLAGMALDVPVSRSEIDDNQTPQWSCSVSDAGSEHDEYSSASATASAGHSRTDSWGSHANIQLDIDKDVLKLVPLELLDKKNDVSEAPCQRVG